MFTKYSFSYFNPRSHERSDYVQDVCRSPILFQSTLPREERPKGVFICRYTSIFQSTLPREERHAWQDKSGNIKSISIHAPTRGATCISFHKISRHQFQSTLPREERLIVKIKAKFVSVFQSTLPREERLYLCRLLLHFLYFNPRSHERSDGARHSSV